MNKKQIETLLHYVTIAMEQANKYKEMYDSMPNNLSLHYEKPLSQEKIDGLEYANEDLQLQLASYRLIECTRRLYTNVQYTGEFIRNVCDNCNESFE